MRLQELVGSRLKAWPIRRQAALALAAISRQRIRAERDGVPLPDSADVLTRLREERAHELSASS